jgi:hypothetical protein
MSIAKGRGLQGRGQKVYYWYVVVSAVSSVLTSMATAIAWRLKSRLQKQNPPARVSIVRVGGLRLYSRDFQSPGMFL